MKSLENLADRWPAINALLAEPHAVSRQLETQLRRDAARYVNRPAKWQALLEAVTLELNDGSDVERSVVVARESR